MATSSGKYCRACITNAVQLLSNYLLLDIIGLVSLYNGDELFKKGTIAAAKLD